MKRFSTKAEVVAYRKELLQVFRELYLHTHGGDDNGHKEYMQRTRLQDKPIGYLEANAADVIINCAIAWNDVTAWARSVKVSKATLDELYAAVTKSAAEQACACAEGLVSPALPRGMRMYISDELFEELCGRKEPMS